MRHLPTYLFLTVLLFTLISCNGGGDLSPTATGTTFPDGKPTGVTAVAGDKSATVSWNSVAGAVGYSVYLSTDGFNFVKYRGEIFNSLSLTVLNLINGDTYYFGVSAVGSTGWESAIAYAGGSPTAMAIVPEGTEIPVEPWIGTDPLPPTNLQGEASDGTAVLLWEPSSSPDLAYYRIWRLVGDSIAGYELIQDEWTEETYTDSDLINGNSYFYYVTSYDIENRESVPSNTILLIPLNLVPSILTNMDILLKTGRIIIEWDIPTDPDIAGYSIERVEPVEIFPGVEVITRFLIAKPTGSHDDPDSYAQGQVLAYVDADANRTVLEDRSVEEAKFYKYRIAAIDTFGQEGPPVEIDHVHLGPTF